MSDLKFKNQEPAVEILRITPEGFFTWAPEADKIIANDPNISASMRSLLKRLRESERVMRGALAQLEAARDESVTKHEFEVSVLNVISALREVVGDQQ
jgi:hypothetical protein